MVEMEKYKLGDICEIVSGSTPKTNIDEYWEGTIKWITPAELNDDTYIITDSVRKITELAVKKTGLKSFPEGTVILSSRAPIGKVAIAGCEMYCNQGFKNLICSKKINNKYLYWFLKGNTVFLNSLGRGATFKELSKSIVSNIEINLPDIVYQKKAVETLEKVSEIIALRKRELSSLDDLIKARFVEMFGDPATNPMRWSETTIGDECFYIKDGPHKSLPDIGKENGGHPFISVRNIVNGYIDFSTARYISDEDYANAIKKCHPEKGDMLYSKGGTTGIAKLIDIDEEFANWVHVAVLKFDKSKLNGIFFENMLNGDYCFEQSQRLTKGIANRDLVLSAMAQIKMYRPPMEIQKQFADFVNQVDKSKLYKISTLQFPCIPG
jgi:type I restriction enzyme S subunit